MIIEDPESFKIWLTTILEPMCEADPAALAKYVYALVKKDKPIPELKESMLSQLHVFLQNETVSFVTMLFEKLLTIPKTPTLDQIVRVKQEPEDTGTTVAAAIAMPGIGEETNVERQDKRDEPGLELDIHERDIKEQGEQDNETKDKDEEKHVFAAAPVPSVVTAPVASNNVPHSSASTSKRDPAIEKRTSRPRDAQRDHRNKSDSEKDERDRDRRPRAARRSSSQRMRSRTPRSRSRSRSWEQRHSRRSRSRDRERDRSGAWRNKSPPNRRYERDRRRSWSKSPVRSRALASRSRSRTPRSRSRSPPSKRVGRYGNRSPPSHSRSRSPRDSRHDKDTLSGPGTPTQDSNHAEPDLRLSINSQSIQSIVNQKEPGGNSYRGVRRCRDFDEKGYCMRGDLCLYDHGTDPVILEDVALPQVLSSYQNTSLPPPSGSAVLQQDMSVRPPALPGQQTNLGIMNVPIRSSLIRSPATNNAEYNPDAPGYCPDDSVESRMWGRPPFRGAPNMRGIMRTVGGMRSVTLNPGPAAGYIPHHQRELVSVPVADRTMTYKPEDFAQTDVEARLSAAKRRPVFDFRSMNSRRGGLIGSKTINHLIPQDNCSLELKKIPRGVNNITHLNNHFAKFGKIVNIQVSYEGDPEAALITFSSHAEANAAYKSTEAVLNNRFIKVYWHNSEGKQENVPPRRTSVKERLGAPVMPAASNKVLNTLQPSAVHQNEDINTSQLDKMAAVSLVKKNQAILAAKETIKKKQEEKRKEALKLTADLRKRKQELLTKQLNQQKLLIERLEKCGTAPELRDSLMNTIKTLQESIENIQKDLASAVDKINGAKIPVKVTPQLMKKSREETQRQILDAELDIFNQQQEGKDTTDLQKRVVELKLQAQSLGYLAGPPAPHYPIREGAGRFKTRRGRGNYAHALTHSSVDHRTTKLLVSGFELDDKAEVLAHFSQFGEVIDYVSDDSTPSLVLVYKSRKEAENVIKKGRNFGDRLLSVTWYNAQQNVVNRRSGSHTLHHRSVMMMGEDGGEESLEDVEEEEEEEEISEEILLQEDEEEEDEDRSWRR